MNRKLLEHINKLKHIIACYVTTVYKVSLLSLHFVFIGYFAFAQTLSDNASNAAYNSGWSNATNGGTGFADWSLPSDGFNAGHFKGDPASYGMSSTGIGTTAFALYGHTNHYAYALRNFSTPLGVGDILTFYWAMNWDCGSSGSKGWELKSGSTNVFGVNNANSPTITYNGVASGTVSTNYGITPMLVSIQRISATQYTVSISRRNTSDGTFTTIITSSLAIDNIRIYIGSQQTNAGERNIFFNNFQIQKPNQYRSKASGNWSAASTWEYSTDGGSTWSNAPAAPGSTAYSTITIQNGHTVSQNQNYTSGSNNAIVVASGATLNMNGATGNFQFNTMSVDGILERDDIGSVYSGSSITINNGGVYRHAVNGGSIPTITWSTGATFEVTGITSATSFTSGALQNYHHVVWNCPNQTSSFNFGGLSTINGNLSIQSTGSSPSSSSCLNLTNSTAITATIGANLAISGGYFAPFGTSTSASSSLSINGNLSMSAGTFDLYRPASNTGSINLGGDFSMSGGTLTKTGAGTSNFNFSKTGTQAFSKTGGTISNAINFIVNSGSILNMGSSVLDGSAANFTLNTGAGFTTAHVNGITTTGASGAIQVGGTRTFGTGANYTYNGTSAQVSGTGLTGANNLTINNSAGVTLSNNISVANQLSLTNGVFQVGNANTISIANGGSITASAGSLAAGSAAGTISFAGTGTVSGTVGFNHVNIAGGVNFGTASSINGTLSINAGGFVTINAPSYVSGATLKYNTTGTYGRGLEWSTTSGAGYPHHVQISNGTKLNLGANGGTATARQITGNLTVDAGSTLSMNETGNVMTAALTVKGNFNNLGITLLSGSIGGDLILEGDLTDNATFTANGRAIFFNGSNVQNITSSDNPLDIDVMRINKTGGEVVLLQNLLVDETADPIQFTNTNSVLNLNGKTASFGKAGTVSAITSNASSKIKGSSSSSIEILGSGNFGTLYFDQSAPGTSNMLKNLTINAANATLGNALQITAGATPGAVTVGSGAVLVTGGNLVLKSNASGSARIAQSAGTISGSVTVERYIPQNTNRAWRALSVPTYGSQTIANAWQQGTLITGPASCTGMDATTSGFSMYTYSASTDNLVGVSSTASAINNNATNPASYLLYIRGDRNTGLSMTNANPSATTLSTSGSIYQGSVSTDISSNNSSAASTYHLIGNPYASPININSFLSTNSSTIENYIYVWDPKMLNTVHGVGGIVTLNYNGTSYDPNTSGLSYSNGTSELPSGMAFFVQKKTNCTSCSVNFTEAMKSSGAITSNGYKTTSGLDGKMQINLQVKINDSTEGVADGLLAVYDAQAQHQVWSNEDALKMSNFGESMSIRNGVHLLAIEKRPLRSIDTLTIQTNGLLNRNYSLVFNPSQFGASVQAKLIDHYLKTEIPVSLQQKTSYLFNIDANPASKAGNRFELLYYQNTLDIKSSFYNLAIQAYPNPTDGKLFIDMHQATAGNYSLHIMNAFGETIIQKEITFESGDQPMVDLSNQAKGLYYIKITNEQKEQVVLKIIHL